MTWHNTLSRLAGLGATFRCPSPPADLLHRQPRPGTDAAAISSAQSGLSLFLGLTDSDALALACATRAHRDAALALAPDGTAAAPLPWCLDAAGEVLSAALVNGSCLLALPFNRPALQLLRQLPGKVQAPIVIVESPPLHECLARWRLPGTALTLCSVTEAIQRVKAGAGAAPALYISFPELHRRSVGTTASVLFLGQPTLFSLFEPLLCLHGLKTLVTMALDTTTAGPALVLGPLSTASVAVPDRSAAPAALLRWLVGQLQTMARTLPEQTLSWPQLYRSSAHFQAIARSNRLKQLEAFFDAWQVSGSGLQGQTHAFVMSQFAALRSTV